MHESDVDVVVLGAGPAGEVLAGQLAGGGLDVALVEPRLVGGECSFWGCMPSKAMLRPFEILAEVRRIPGAREALGDRDVDVQAVLDRRDEVIHDLDDSVQMPWLEERDVRLLRGTGRLVGERRVEVTLNDGGTETLAARRAVVVATGTRPTMPPVDGLDEVGGWTNREGTTADEVPGRLVVVGGGPIGAELAQAWASLGATVTLLEAADHILLKEEPFAAEQVADGLRGVGVDVREGVRMTKVSRGDDGTVTVETDGGTIEADEILVAAGRTANTDDLGLDVVGVAPGKGGYVEVDDALRVDGHDWLYVVGDANGRALLTHMGKRQARVASARILGDAEIALQDDEPDGLIAPRTTFTDPQVAAVGHTLESARAAGIDAEVVDSPTDGNAGASFWGKDAGGTTRFVYDRQASVLVGATFVGADVVEQLHAATIAVVAKVPLSVLDRAVPTFPTRNEVWLRLIDR